MKFFFKQFFFLLDAQARKGLPWMIVFFLLSSLLDVVGIGFIGAFIGLLINPKIFIDKLPGILSSHLMHTNIVAWVGASIIVAFLLKTLFALMIQKKMVFFCQSLGSRLTVRMMTAYQHAPYLYHLKKNSSHLISRIQTNLRSYVNNLLLPILALVCSGLMAGLILIFLLFLHPIVTLFLTVMFIAFGVIYDLFQKKKLAGLSKSTAEADGHIVNGIRQGLSGFMEIRVLGKEGYFLSFLKKFAHQVAYANGVLAAAQLLPRYVAESMIAIFIVGLSLLGIASGMDKGQVVALVAIFSAAGARLLPTVNQIISSAIQVRVGYFHMHLVYNEFIELEALKVSSAKRLSETCDRLPFHAVELRDVTYAYPRTAQNAVQHIHLTFKKGQSIGLIGTSGAGKSTLVNVILGFLEPQQGKILVDHQPIDDLRAWLNNFAYIPQTIFLLDDTMRRNVAFGVEDENIDEALLNQAVEMAQLKEVVAQLPHGLDTVIGENGIRLSGGQRQRVALARAFYHERDIIVLDEATSSLDNETEKEVINTIKRLHGSKTLIVIAHRLTTVAHCDVLYRLEHGQIVAQGSYTEVIGV